MSCNLLSGGIFKGCENNAGSVRRLWLKDKSLIDSVAHGSPVERISAITVDGGSKFYEFQFMKKSGSNYIEVETTSDTGSTVYVQTITLVLTRREQSKRDVLRLMGKGKELVAIIEDANGIFWYLGEYEGLIMTENNGGSGAQKADLNGYTITFVAEETDSACEITEAAVTSLIE